VRALRAEVVEAHAFDRLHRVGRAAELERRLLQVARAADVAIQRAAAADGDGRAGNHDADRLNVASGRDGVEHFARHHRARGDALRVDDGRFRSDGDRLFDRAHLELDVDGGGEVGSELDVVTLDRAETRQGVCHDVGAGPQVGDLVLTAAVG